MKEYIFVVNEKTPDAIGLSVGHIRRNSKELIRCKDCKKWKRNDGTFPDFDGKEWHGCKELETFTSKIWNEAEPVTPSWFYCGYADRREE